MGAENLHRYLRPTASTKKMENCNAVFAHFRSRTSEQLMRYESEDAQMLVRLTAQRSESKRVLWYRVHENIVHDVLICTDRALKS